MSPSPAVLLRLAALLDYPGPDLAARIGACADALAAAGGTGAARLRRFAATAAAEGTAALEEAYTAAFDLAPLASPYLGDQLFGAGAERAALLAGLRELQRDAGLAPGPELPDHVAEVLRLAAAPVPTDVRDDLVRDGLSPVLGKMLAALEAGRSPWADVVAAVLEALAGAEAAGSRPADAPRPLPVEVSP